MTTPSRAPRTLKKEISALVKMGGVFEQIAVENIQPIYDALRALEKKWRQQSATQVADIPLVTSAKMQQEEDADELSEILGKEKG